MLKGVNLTLLMGPVVPVPVPRVVLEALETVQVTTSVGEASGFQLAFTISSKSMLNTLLLLLPKIGPVVRVIVVVTMGGRPNVLMDGVITNQQISPNVEAGKSTVTLTGSDLTAVMDKIELTGIPYPAMPDFARVALILAKYAAFGIIPLVIPSIFTELQNPLEGFYRHKGTDLGYIKMLAQEVGYVFYIDPGPVPGTNKAYWGPEIKVGVPQPALNINMDAHNNLEALNFSYNGESKTLPIVYIHNKETKVPIPIPIPGDISPLNPPLGAIQPFPSKLEFLKETAKLSPLRAIGIGLAVAGKSADAVTGSGKLDVLRYGRILKARQLVGVRGAGQAFDGLYFVKSVTHEIKRNEYKQSFSLTRNGLVSITPRVPA